MIRWKDEKEQIKQKKHSGFVFSQTIRILIHKNNQENLEFDGEIELYESYFGGVRKGKRGRGATGKILVFVLPLSFKSCINWSFASSLLATYTQYKDYKKTCDRNSGIDFLYDKFISPLP